MQIAAARAAALERKRAELSAALASRNLTNAAEFSRLKAQYEEEAAAHADAVGEERARQASVCVCARARTSACVSTPMICVQLQRAFCTQDFACV